MKKWRKRKEEMEKVRARVQQKKSTRNIEGRERAFAGGVPLRGVGLSSYSAGVMSCGGWLQ